VDFYGFIATEVNSSKYVPRASCSRTSKNCNMTEPDILALSSTERQRTVQRFVRQHSLHLPSSSWGFAIFGTTYTPESYQEGNSISTKLEAYVRLEAQADLEDTKTGPQYIYDPEPNRCIGEKFKNVVFDDKEKFDGVGFDVIYETFREWMKVNRDGEGKGVARKVCLVIDWEGFEALRDAPDPSVDTEEACYIKALDCIYKREDAYGSPDPQYPGWVKAGIGELWRVYCIMEGSMGLETRCEKGKGGVLYFE
jgi:hypothetical protein